MNPLEVLFESPSEILQISGITFLEHSRSSFLGACRSYFVVPLEFLINRSDFFFLKILKKLFVETLQIHFLGID